MVWFFRKQRKANAFTKLLSYSDNLYADSIFELFQNLDRNTRAQVLVAYQNLLMILSVTYTSYEETGEKITVEKFISQIEIKLEQCKGDEVNFRRWSWFLFAALLGRMEKISTNNSAISIVASKIWCVLADDSVILHAVLPNNVVWTEEEKEWFDLSLKDEKMVQWVVNHAMPPQFSNTEYVSEFAHQRDLFYWPSKSRIGFIP